MTSPTVTTRHGESWFVFIFRFNFTVALSDKETVPTSLRIRLYRAPLAFRTPRLSDGREACSSLYQSRVDAGACVRALGEISFAALIPRLFDTEIRLCKRLWPRRPKPIPLSNYVPLLVTFTAHLAGQRHSRTNLC